MEGQEQPLPKQEGIKRSPNFAEIQRPEGTYSILYGEHGVVQSPKDLPDKCDGLFLETAGTKSDDNYSADPVNTLYAFKSTFTQYKELIPAAEQKRIPIYFADVNLTVPGEVLGVVTVTPLPLAESIVGAKFIADVTRNALQHKLSRRDALKAGLAAWLTPSTLGLWGRIFSDKTGRGEDITVDLDKLVEKAHPEDNLLLRTMRNTVIAYKEQWLMEKGNNPSFTTAIGGAHTGLEDQVQSSLEDKLKFLKTIKPLVEKFIQPESFYTISKVNYNDRASWEKSDIFEVPELKELIQHLIV